MNGLCELCLLNRAKMEYGLSPQNKIMMYYNKVMSLCESVLAFLVVPLNVCSTITKHSSSFYHGSQKTTLHLLQRMSFQAQNNCINTIFCFLYIYIYLSVVKISKILRYFNLSITSYFLLYISITFKLC